MADSEKNKRDKLKVDRLNILLSIGNSLLVLVISYHIVRQKLLEQQQWTIAIICTAVVLLAYFITTLFVLVKELTATNEQRLRLALRKVLTVQGIVISLLFIFSVESAAVFSALCLSKARNFYSLKTTYFILGYTVIIFTLSFSFYYGEQQGVLGVAIFVILVTSFYLFTLTYSHNAAKEKELRQRAFDLNRELLATQELLAQSSRQSERLRIARDMHDLLGHQLTALILNLEVASHLAEGQSQQKVEQSLALAKLLLGDLRNAVSDLRESASLDFNRALEKLIANIPELEVSFTLEDGLKIGNVETAETLIRCIQESLTNTLRHANASQCWINLFSKEGELILHVKDNGSVKHSIQPGNGLKGMLERVKALQGKLHWREQSGSFFLEAAFPLRVI